MQRLHLLERLEGVLRAGLLPDADDGVQDQDCEDDGRLHEGFQRDTTVLGLLEERQHGRQAGGAEQDLHELIVKLLKHQLPQRRRFLLLELIRAVLGAASFDLGGRETLLGVYALLLQEGLGREVGGILAHVSCSGGRCAAGCFDSFRTS